MKLVATLLAVLVSCPAFASPYPNGPAPIARKVNGKWQQVSSANPLTDGKSRMFLEVLQYIQNGEIPLQLDMTDWDPPAPKTLAQAFWHLKHNTKAQDILFTSQDTNLWGLDAIGNTDDAIVALVTRLKAAEDTIVSLSARVLALENP